MKSFPGELKDIDSWLLGSRKKVPLTRIDGGHWVAASVTDASLRMPYEVVAAACEKANRGITEHTERSMPGFVLSDETAYAVIDLDVKNETNCDDRSKWTSKSRLKFFQNLIVRMGSYTERSRSGVGVHIWVKVPDAMKNPKMWPNVKRDGVEVYFRDRFILCTGEPVIGYGIPIVDASDKVSDLLRELAPEKFTAMSAVSDSATGDGVVVEEMDDEEVLDRLFSCENAELYLSLWNGDWDIEWNGRTYESQSNGDAALVEGLLFVTNGNKEQAERLFRRSKLADRKKAERGDYVQRTVNSMSARLEEQGRINNDVIAAINPVSANGSVVPASIDDPSKIEVCGQVVDLSSMDTESDVVAAVTAAAVGCANVVDMIVAAASMWRDLNTRKTGGIPLPGSCNVGVMGAPYDVDYKKCLDIGTGESVDLPHPPGVLGRISRWIESDSYKPTKEGAIAATIAYAAGIAGKAFQIDGRTGLNNYVVLLGQSAVGKSTSIDSAHNFHRYVTATTPQADRMFGGVAPGSDVGLLRICEETDSFAIRFNEFGKLLAVASTGKPGPQKAIMDELLRLYDASGVGATINSVVYSKKENNISIPHNVAVSIIGDGVSIDYYKSLSGAMSTDGLLSRLLVIEYTGIRQYSNRKPRVAPPDDLIARVGDIASSAAQHNATGVHVDVGYSINAKLLIDEIEDKTDDAINHEIPDKRKFIATRRAAKIKKLAGLAAVFDNHMKPMIDVHHIEWAAEVVNQCMAREMWWIDQGVVAGASDNIDVENLYMKRIIEFFKNPYGDSMTLQMAKDGVIQLSTLKMIARGISAIESYKSGNGARGYKAVIDELKASGRMYVFSRRKAKMAYNSGADCYCLYAKFDNP